MINATGALDSGAENITSDMSRRSFTVLSKIGRNGLYKEKSLWIKMRIPSQQLLLELNVCGVHILVDDNAVKGLWNFGKLELRPGVREAGLATLFAFGVSASKSRFQLLERRWRHKQIMAVES